MKDWLPLEGISFVLPRKKTEFHVGDRPADVKVRRALRVLVEFLGGELARDTKRRERRETVLLADDGWTSNVWNAQFFHQKITPPGSVLLHWLRNRQRYDRVLLAFTELFPLLLEETALTLSGADLRSLHFVVKNATELDLSGAVLSASRWSPAPFTDEDTEAFRSLQRARFHAAVLEKTIFEELDLSNANFSGATLIETQFKDCVFHAPVFANATLDRVEFRNVLLSEGGTFSLEHASVTECAFVRERERNTKQDLALAKVDFSGVELRGDFSHVNFSGAILPRTAPAVSFYKADLSGADLRGADLRFADLRRANLHGAQLQGARLAFAALDDGPAFGVSVVPFPKSATVRRALRLFESLRAEERLFFASLTFDEGSIQLQLSSTQLCGDVFIGNDRYFFQWSELPPEPSAYFSVVHAALCGACLRVGSVWRGGTANEAVYAACEELMKELFPSRAMGG